MSLPSDVTADVTPDPVPGAKETGAGSAHGLYPRAAALPTNRLNAHQVGLAVAALVAFLGIAYVGPAVTRLTRKPSLPDRLRHARRDAEAAGKRAGRQVDERAREFGQAIRRWR